MDWSYEAKQVEYMQEGKGAKPISGCRGWQEAGIWEVSFPAAKGQRRLHITWCPLAVVWLFSPFKSLNCLASHRPACNWLQSMQRVSFRGNIVSAVHYVQFGVISGV